jgi:hypothetical protein
MKAFTITALLQIFLFLSVFSQNYECLKDDDIYFFDRIIAEPDLGQPPVRAYRIDSALSSGNDLILCTHKELLNRDPASQYGCWDPDAGSWIGDVRVTPEGDYYFHNDVYVYSNQLRDYVNVHDEMLVKSQAQVGETWTFYSNDSIGDYAYAEVAGIDILDVLGTMDSVKYIQVRRYSDDELLFVLRISKNYGFQRAINFRDYYPGGFYPFNLLTERYEVYELTGIEGSDKGTHKLTVGDVYNFDVGDEFDVLAEVDSEQGFILEFIYYINTVLDKSYSSNGDTVFYEIDSLSWIISNDSMTLYHDTVERAFTNLDQLLPDDQYLPFETKYNDSSDVSYMGMFRYDFERIHFFAQYQYYSGQEGDTCFTYPFAGKATRSPNWIFTEYIDGCGSYYFELHDDGISCAYCSLLMYYNKEGEEWGEPLIPPLGLNEVNKSEIELNVFPNPAKDQLNVKCDNLNAAANKTYRLINSSGITVEEVTTGKAEMQFDISNLPQGIYLLVLFADNGLVFHRKVVIF